MAKTSEVPVLIVGGGAVGCVLSMELARRGVDFRCIERMPGPAAESRAIALHARTIELLERVDTRLSQRILDRDLRHKGYVMHFVRDGERSEVRPGLDYSSVQSRYNCIMSHNQSETEGFIRNFSRSEFGATIEYNTRFVDLAQDGNEVRVRVVHADQGDREEVIRCRYLVAADGINSRVRQGLGFSLREKDYKGSFFQNLDIFLNGFDDWTDHFHYCVGTDHFLMVAALPGGHFRLLLSDRGEADDPDVTPQQAFGRLLDQHFDGITFGDIVWHSKWETWERLADTFRKGNVLLAGDAAHVHSTTGGQGMNCCMQDAFNLGWKLALVLKGQARPELLDTYETERRPVAEQVIWAASSLHDIFMAHGKSIAAREKAMFEPGYTERVVNTCSGVSYTYKDYVEKISGLADIDGPAIGDRAPDVDFEGGGALWDHCRHPDYTLLVMPGGDDSDASGATVNRIDRLKDRFGPVMRVAMPPRSGALSAVYGPDDGRLYLMRPDGYIGFKSRASDAGLLEEYLDNLLTL
jgi:2-polyprenyl-6-methoxyphenol hydroxylase-like FAD-dependent oxidoreductase